MAFNLRLKTKLVIAISGMVVALVVTLLTIYVSRLVHQAVRDAYDSGSFVAEEIVHSAREAIESNFESVRIKPANPQ